MRTPQLLSNKYAIIVAGGSGTRMGTDIPKQFLLLNGIPILMQTINTFYDYDPQITIIVVLPEEQKNYWQKLCTEHRFNRQHTVVTGGMTRFHSVKNALKYVPENAFVAIHDGVRPLVSREIITRTFEAAEKAKAACPVIPLTDSIRKKVRGMTKQVNRRNYFLVQTPQVFSSSYIIEAYKQDFVNTFTDDISVFESYRQRRPVLVEGSPENIKITTPVDLIIAEAILKCRT
ncbi:2-C-methyl-D-erythritol 4-phosphate cytidylyltransferase [Bacteroidia bacterium]|nr:2-C-methyl-D-erythritol 4-phosphate cytidylyltransferase [Bacteroidia bacterium]